MLTWRPERFDGPCLDNFKFTAYVVFREFSMSSKDEVLTSAGIELCWRVLVEHTASPELPESISTPQNLA